MRSQIDTWLYLAMALTLSQCGLYVVLKARLGSISILLWQFGPTLIMVLAIMTLVTSLVSSLSQPLRWSWWRMAGFSGLIAVAYFSYAAYTVYPSSYDRIISPVKFRVPLDGAVTVLWGGDTPQLNYHVGSPNQRWAYDLIVTKEGKSHKGVGYSIYDYYVYDQPVLAPANGIVKMVTDGEPDMPVGIRSRRPYPGGNSIVIEVSSGQYLFLGHLKPGSIRVRSGDQVNKGQELARVGNSGKTTAPHLHIHLQDSMDLRTGEGIPLYFYNYRCEGRIIERGIPTGGDARQIIEQLSP